MNGKLEVLQHKLLLKGINFQLVTADKIVVDFPYTVTSKSFSLKFLPTIILIGLGIFLVNILNSLFNSNSNDIAEFIAQIVLILFLGFPALLLGLAFFAFGGTAFIVALFSGPKIKNALTGRIIVFELDGGIKYECDDEHARLEFEKFLVTVFSSNQLS
jgi:hypothetical protein